MKWYYVENGQQAGPVEETDFPQLVQLGKLRADTLVWREGLANWEAFSTACPQAIAATQAAAPPVAAPAPAGSVPEAVCAECGGLFNKEDMIPHGNVFICARCKPVFLQKLAEGVPVHTGMLRYAGFWIRVGAKMVDGLILGVPFAILFLAFFFSAMPSLMGGSGNTPSVSVLIWLVVLVLGYFAANAFYYIFFVGRSGATPGKKLCKLKIVSGEGGPISYGRAAGRFFSEMGIVAVGNGLCYVLGYADYIALLFDKEQKRTLHDRICNTRVIYTEP